MQNYNVTSSSSINGRHICPSKIINGEKSAKIDTPQHLIQHPVQLVSGLTNSISVIAVNHKDKPLRVLEVMSPQRTNLKSRIKEKIICRRAIKPLHFFNRSYKNLS